MADRKTSDNVISVKGLKKSYGKVVVLRGIDFSVPRGGILALLGPNGAGKTTTIRILSTLLQADGGKASIDGYDVMEQPGKIRENIGLTGQYAAVDEYLTGEENLHMMGRLYRLSKKDTKRRTQELIDQVDLAEASKRPVKTYSGGMKRRIDLAMSIISAPPVLFLDEPTTGLDPRSRAGMWEVIRKLADSGTTILLTTQYMDEADQLADNIVVIDDGKVIAQGTSTQLKAKVGSDRLELTISAKSNFEEAVAAVKGEKAETNKEARTISVVASKSGVNKLKQVLQKLETSNIQVDNVSLHRPTLDDVFMSLTGHVATKAEPTDKKKKGKK